MVQALLYHMGRACTGRHDGSGLPRSFRSPVFWFLVVLSLAALLLRVAAEEQPRYEWWELLFGNLLVVTAIPFIVKKEVVVPVIACFLLLSTAHDFILILVDGWMPKELALLIDAALAIAMAVDMLNISGDIGGDISEDD